MALGCMGVAGSDVWWHFLTCLLSLQAIRAGLKALHGLGVWGVTVNVWWSQVEASPRQYDWAQYQAVFDAAREFGLRVKVCMQHLS